VGVSLGFGVGVTVGVAVLPVGITVGEVVGFAVGLVVGCDDFVGLTVAEGVTSSVIIGTGVGLINITLIAPSSGTGETIFFPDTRTPMMTMTRTMTPTMMVSAAIVFFRSSMA